MRKKIGLGLILVFGIKAGLSVLLGTGFDPLLVGMNGIMLVAGFVLIFLPESRNRL